MLTLCLKIWVQGLLLFGVFQKNKYNLWRFLKGVRYFSFVGFDDILQINILIN